MFLHVAVLGPFAESIFRMFEEAAPGRNVHVAFARDETPSPPLSSVRLTSVQQVLDLVRGGGPWEGMTTNGLSDSEMVDLAAGLPDGMKCAWYVWGFESYSRAARLRKRLLTPLTKAATHTPAPSLKAAVGRQVRRTLQDIHDWRCPPFDRFDFCVTPLQEEYEIFRDARLFRRTRYRWGSVGALEDYVDGAAEIGHRGNDIQVGNSATPVLNHLDALNVIAGMPLADRRVLVPLSYGDPDYRETVVRYGESLLGDRFVPVVDFLPLAEYSALMEPCGIVVMNQMRQHAVGNVLNAVWRGAVVYLNDTATYRTFRRLGIDVRLFDREFVRDAGDGFPPLSIAQVLRHRELLRAHRGRERVVNETRSLLADLARSGSPDS